MPTFAYDAVNASGKKVNGTIDAASPEEAMKLVRGQGLFPSGMKEQKAAYQKELEEKDSFKAKASAYGKDFLGMVSATPTDLHGNVPRLKSDIDGLKSKIKKMEGEGYKKGGKVKSASSRADGIAQRGKTRGKML